MPLQSIVRLLQPQARFGSRWPPPPVRDSVRWRAEAVAAGLRDTLEAELDERRGFLWLAVAFAAGALAYLSLPGEPSLLALVAATSICGGFGYSAWRRGGGWRIVVLLAAVLGGMSAGKIRVASLEGPTIGRPLTTELSGRVIGRESRTDRRPRIVLDRLRSEAIATGEAPDRIRLTLSPKAVLPPLGSRIALRARLTPLPGPAVPGAYDPRMAGFFAGLGGAGFVLGGWTETEPPDRSAADLLVARIRQVIVDRIRAVLPGESGAVAAALLVGERSALSEDTNESLRLSGLAHILSISGLHMMLISGCAFFAVRAVLALSPALALRYPIRKWAAVAALLVVSAYFTLSGGGAATVRSYIMAVIMFAAILADRPAISMRNLALALFIVLLLEPEGVVEPGFQMSFAAVAALIAGWEAWQGRDRADLADHSAFPGLWILRAAAKALVGVALTTIVASLATAPYGAYHFERIATYSLLGNLLASPIVSAIIMPFGLLALVALPFGLEALPLMAMAGGIDALLAASDWVAGLSGAEVRAPGLTGAGLLVITAGFLWLSLWRQRRRLFGIAAILAGFAINPLFRASPDLLVTEDGRTVAVRDATGVLRVSGSRAGSFVAEQIYEKERSGPLDGEAMRAGTACDRLGCILPGAENLRVAHVADPAAFLEDCGRVDLIVTRLTAPQHCASLIVDGPALLRTGAQAITILGTQPLRIETTRARSPLPRPWQRTGPIASPELAGSDNPAAGDATADDAGAQ